MFPLKSIPQSTDALRNDIADTLGRYLNGVPPTVSIDGDLAAIDELLIDTSQAEVITTATLPKLPDTALLTDKRPGPTVRFLELRGHPILIEGSKLHFSFEARDASFSFAYEPAGDRHWLQLDRTVEGKIETHMRRSDLEHLIVASAAGIAAEKGITITSTQLDLTSPDDRSVAMKLTVNAKKLFVSAVITITGHLRVDDAFLAHVSNLRCSGTGMVGSMVCPYLQTHLDKANGRSISLLLFPVGGVTLKDLKVTTTDGIAIAANFA